MAKKRAQSRIGMRRQPIQTLDSGGWAKHDGREEFTAKSVLRRVGQRRPWAGRARNLIDLGGIVGFHNAMR